MEDKTNQTGDKRDKALQAISKDPYRLIKTNPIINAKFDITAVQMKVFLKVIASIDQSGEEMPEINISIKEFQEFVGGKAKNIHSYLQAELTKLRKKDIYYEDERIRLEASFFSSIVYHKNEGYFTFEFSKNIKPFLLQIKDNFTVLDIRNLLYLDSIYAIRFYEFCKEFERFKTFEFDVEELKEKFGLTDRYKNYFDFKLKVLHQARAELIENSELYFDFEEIKSGKRVVRLKFFIIKNKKVLQRKEESEETQIHVKDIHALIKEYVSEETVITWFKKFSYEQIKKGVSYSINEKKEGRVKDMARYLQKMVATPDLFDSGEQKREEQSKKKQQTKDQQASRQQEAGEEQSRNDLKKAFFQRRVDLINSLIDSEKGFTQKIMQQLRKENIEEKTEFLAELALGSYKPKNNLESDSKEEFMFNFSAGGSFQSYVLSKIGELYPREFNAIKDEFIPKAKSIGLKEGDLL